MAGSGAPATLVGHHGCEREVAERLVAGEPFRPSREPHQWLGAGVYFWDGDPLRALEWATERRSPTPFKTPAVVRVEVEYRSVLDMDNREHQDLVESLYPVFEMELAAQGVAIPENIPHPEGIGRPSILRRKDHAVIEFICRTIEEESQSALAEGRPVRFPPFQVVRGSFEGWKQLYAGSNFYKRSHRQFAVRDSACIKRVTLEGVYRRALRSGPP